MAAQTIYEIEEALNDYADYAEVGSVSRAKTFVTACKRWLFLAAGQSNNESSGMSRNVSEINEMRRSAESYIAVNDTVRNGQPGSVRFLGASGGFR